MKHPDYPGVSSFTDNRGAERWRFRKSGLPTVYLPGEPGSDEFDAAYRAAIMGRAAAPKAEVIKHPRAAHPQSLNAAWAIVKARPKFQKLEPATRYQYTYLIEDFLDARMPNGMKRGDGPVADLKARHIQEVLDGMSASNSTILRVVLRKMMKEAIRQEWIEYDPTYSTESVEKDPGAGFKAWPPHFCAWFEQAWPIGTTARTAYELARWLGTRRSDIVLLRWDMLATKIVDGEAVEGFEFVQHKGRKKAGAFAKFHPVSPMLAEALAPLDRTTGTVLVNRYGNAFSMNSLSVLMKDRWAPKAKIPRGYTLHGLRKAMGAMLADAGASLHESRDMLGHATYKEVANYNKGRDQAISATRGSRAVVRLVKGG